MQEELRVLQGCHDMEPRGGPLALWPLRRRIVSPSITLSQGSRWWMSTVGVAWAVAESGGVSNGDVSKTESLARFQRRHRRDHAPIRQASDAGPVFSGRQLVWLRPSGTNDSPGLVAPSPSSPELNRTGLENVLHLCSILSFDGVPERADHLHHTSRRASHRRGDAVLR